MGWLDLDNGIMKIHANLYNDSALVEYTDRSGNFRQEKVVVTKSNAFSDELKKVGLPAEETLCLKIMKDFLKEKGMPIKGYEDKFVTYDSSRYEVIKESDNGSTKNSIKLYLKRAN